MNVPLTLDVLGTPEGIANPYPAYKAFRAASPVRYMRLPAGGATGFAQPVYAWAVLSHADILSVIRDTATFSSHNAAIFKTVPYMALIHDDPPHHTQLRRMANKAFSPARIAALSEFIGQLANELLDSIGRGPVELMRAYAVPLPMRVISRMLGIPESDYPSFKLWSDAFVSFMGVPAEERARRLQELARYMQQAITERRAKPSADLISAFIEAEVEGARLSDEEIRRLVSILLIAGNETTTHLIGNMMGLLADRPELWQRAREDRSLIDPIIEEVLRYESPVQRMPRVTTRPVRMGEVELGAGELVDVYYGASGRDPAVFDEPETFRPGRPNISQHLGFAQGTHYCLGASLARLEARISLNAFLDRFPTLTRGDAPAVRQGAAPLSFGYRSLPLVLGGNQRVSS